MTVYMYVVCMHYVMLYVLSSLCVWGQRPGTSQERVHSPCSTARDELQAHPIVTAVRLLAIHTYVHHTYIQTYIHTYILANIVT